MADESFYVLDERSLRWLRHEIRRQVQAALHQTPPQTARTWRPGRGGGSEDGGGLNAFELKYSLTPGGSTQAYLLNWEQDPGQYTFDDTAENPPEITVIDAIGKYRGYGRVDVDGENPAIEGFRGYAIKGSGAIVNMQIGVTMFIAELAESQLSVPATADTFEINTDTIRKWEPTSDAPWYTSTLKPPGTVYNLLRIGNDILIRGTMMMWRRHADDIPAGWLRMDGTTNQQAYITEDGDGDTVDMQDYFPRGRADRLTMDNNPLGTLTHSHEIQPGSIGITDTGVTCNNEETVNVAAGVDALGWPVSGTAAAFCHSHSIATDEHSHTADEEEHLPPYKRPHFIERDNINRRLALCIWNDDMERYEGMLLATSTHASAQDDEDAAVAAEEPGAAGAAEAAAGELIIEGGVGVFVLG